MREEKLTRKLELLSLPDISLFNVYTQHCVTMRTISSVLVRKSTDQRVKCIYKRVHFLEIVSFCIVGAFFFDRDNDRRIEICLNEDI